MSIPEPPRESAHAVGERDVPERGASADARTSGLAATALALGVASLVAMLSLVLSPVALILAVIAIVVGVVALVVMSRRDPAQRPRLTGRIPAVVGIVVSVLTLLLAAVFAAGAVTVLNNDSAVDRIEHRLSDLRDKLPGAGSNSGDAAGSVDPGTGGVDAPTTTEAAPDRQSPAGLPIPAAEMGELVAAKYAQEGGQIGYLGAAQGCADDLPDNGRRCVFDGGEIVTGTGHGAHVVQGEILREYNLRGGPAGVLGFPASDQLTIDNGFESNFDGGVIRWILDDAGRWTAEVETN